jgi:hypothetical protein
MTDKKRKSRGRLRIEKLFSEKEIGILQPEPHTDRAVTIFLDDASDKNTTVVAPRLTFMPKGVLFLMAIEEEPAAGVICIYDRENGDFYSVIFDGDYDHISMTDYEKLVMEYGLLEYAAQPDLITALNRPLGNA